MPHLQQQPQLAADLAGVQHHEHQVGRGVSHEALHHGLVLAAAAEVVEARQVHQLMRAAMAIVWHGSPQQLHRQPRPVGDGRVAAGEPVEEGRLAGVGHPQQGEPKALTMAIVLPGTMAGSGTLNG